MCQQFMVYQRNQCTRRAPRRRLDDGLTLVGQGTSTPNGLAGSIVDKIGTWSGKLRSGKAFEKIATPDAATLFEPLKHWIHGFEFAHDAFRTNHFAAHNAVVRHQQFG